ncbi:MAG: hypothetical protein KBC96_12845 [Armatimonadetes bacterium]|nr:hypothetical protein [Armatimonadota bacterium]
MNGSRTSLPESRLGLPGAKADRTQAALDFVLRALADAGGSLPRKDLIELAKVEGIAKRTLEIALRDAVCAGELSKAKNGRDVIYSQAEPTLLLE